MIKGDFRDLKGDYLIFRADSSSYIGNGHVMRCLALAQAWQDAGGYALFLMAMEAPTLEAWLKREKIEVIPISAPPGSRKDAIQTSKFTKEMGAPWLVLDGYHFDENYQKWIKESGQKLFVIDDIAQSTHYYADVILNQNLHADALDYYCEPYTKLLLGTRYVLLRREFLKWQCWKRKYSKVASRLLISMGGTDPENVTYKVIQALQKVEIKGLEAKVAVGGSNPHHEKLQLAIRNSRFPISLEENVTKMDELMAWADMAISAGGSTCWELAFMALPNLILIWTDNQQSIAARLETAGAALNLGWHENVSFTDIAQAVKKLLSSVELRAKMAQSGRAMVNGKGVSRVMTTLARIKKT